jgi:hypothetical protein
MKKLIFIYAIAAALGLTLIIAACTNLDEVVYDKIISEEFSPTANDAFAIMGPAYTELRNYMFGWVCNFDTQEECSDIVVTPARPNGWVDGGIYRAMHEHIWNSEQYHCGNIWSHCYTGINYVNRSLYQIESGALPIAEDKDAVVAEIKTLRAFYYYVLCDNFGNVPVVTRYDLPADSLPDQKTRQQVYDFIINEINSNVNNLTDEKSTLYYGRFNQWAAHFLLAKMYLNAEVYTGTPKWDECIAECDQIISSGKYILEPDYKSPFKTQNENSDEIIFAIPYDNITDWDYGWFHLPWKTLHPSSQATFNLEVQPWGGNCAIPQFIDTYDPKDKRLINTWIIGLQFSSTGDTLYCSMKAKYATKPLEYTNFVQGIAKTEEWEGYRIGKYEIALGTRWMGIKTDFPLFRFADVLMMKAECLLRKGDADGAAALVTQVRERDFDDPADAVVTGSQLQEGSAYNYGLVKDGVLTVPEGGGADIQYGRFLDELGWEFAAEARRRQDLIRFGVFTTKSWLSHEPNGDFRTIFPIPQTQLDKNYKLTQNPGY